jgi:site-specific DNA-adenine methylase
MTSYHGGKYRHGEEIALVIKDIYDKQLPGSIVGYIEPFCGMCGVYRHIINLLPKNLKYIASDQHDSLILMWKALQDGWIPPKDCSIKKYEKLKYSKPSPEKGYFGFGASFGGIYFCGHKTKYNRNCDYRDSISTIGKNMKHVKFTNSDYSKHSSLKNFIIYCDPPYEKQSIYYDDTSFTKLTFDSEKFWNWCRNMSKNNIVIISEYTAPSDFKSIYTFNSKRNSQFGDTNLEHLFIHNSLLN